MLKNLSVDSRCITFLESIKPLERVANSATVTWNYADNLNSLSIDFEMVLMPFSSRFPNI